MNFSSELIEKIRQIKLVILDVDGVLTDGTIWLGESEELKGFDVQDGAGVKYLIRAGLQVAILTGRDSVAVSRRAKELTVDICLQGQKVKLPAFEKIVELADVNASETACMGDDLTDLPLLQRCGLFIAPANAVPEIRERTDIITKAAGGHGAVREAAEIILKTQGKWKIILERYLEVQS